VEVRELRLDVFGGPARWSSQFIVTKRAGTSQFEAVAIAAMPVKDGVEEFAFLEANAALRSCFKQKKKGGRCGGFLP